MYLYVTSVLAGRGQGLDLWALGCCIYNLLTARRPFMPVRCPPAPPQIMAWKGDGARPSESAQPAHIRTITHAPHVIRKAIAGARHRLIQR
jgi:serine/threonine protein kinase